MEENYFSRLLIKAAFSCMACDGSIDEKELELLKKLGKDNNLFVVTDLEQEINSLIEEINQKGMIFLKDFLTELKRANLSEDEEIKLIQTSIATIEADENVHYSEIRFFKVMRGQLKVTNRTILKTLPDIEDYLEQDIISDNYLKKLTVDYFATQTIPKFDPIK